MRGKIIVEGVRACAVFVFVFVFPVTTDERVAWKEVRRSHGYVSSIVVQRESRAFVLRRVIVPSPFVPTPRVACRVY